MSAGADRATSERKAPNTQKGTAMRTARGSDHFSYCAARTRKIMTRPKSMT